MLGTGLGYDGETLSVTASSNGAPLDALPHTERRKSGYVDQHKQRRYRTPRLIGMTGQRHPVSKTSSLGTLVTTPMGYLAEQFRA